MAANLRSFFYGLLIGALACPLSAQADVPMTGNFLAAKACPAEQSFNKHSNPGNVMIVAGQTYPIVSANNTPASHYLLMVAGANPERRWVALDCGSVVASSDSISTVPAAKGAGSSADDTTLPPPASQTPAPQPVGHAGPAPGAGTYVLAISWEPGFCADHNTTECQHESSFEGSNFTLHGLWRDPQNRYSYCGNDARGYKSTDLAHHWSDLPDPGIDRAVKAALDQAMPGTQSDLERHEWIKHGTCSETASSPYFARAIDLLKQVNDSPVRALVAGRVGGQVGLDELRSAFDQAFGADAGRRVKMSCESGGHLLSEIDIALQGDVMGSAKLGELMSAALPVGGGSCATARVQAAK